MTYVLDTNIISYFLNKDLEVRSAFKQAVSEGNDFAVSPVVYYEIKRWLVLKNATAKLKAFEELLLKSIKSDLTVWTWEKAVDIYVALHKKGQPVDDSDIMIAAFCIVNDYTLVTNNTKHFQNIDELKITNWKNN